MNYKRLSIILTIICAVLMVIATVYAVLTAAESVPEPRNRQKDGGQL